ncbi:MAG: nitroreductase [Rhizobiaceae bacterium]
MTDLTHYMKTRRSSLSLTLEAPGPDEPQLRTILEIATRVPDHGKLAPWRFELWPMEVRQAMHDRLQEFLQKSTDMPDLEKKIQATAKLLHAPCVLAVISTATAHPKIPLWEQHLSTGAACMNTLIAANSLGFEAQWLTAWYIYLERTRDILGLAQGEQIAGIIHLGTSTVPKSERPRPDIDTLFSIRES